MTAALSVAEQGFECFLVERGSELGGNLRRLRFSIGGGAPAELLEETKGKVLANQLIHVFTDAVVEEVSGYIGHFATTIRSGDKRETLEHGVTIIATGGEPYKPKQYLYGQSPQVITQLELEERMSDPARMKSVKNVVMIQCVGSRGEDLSYCSKVCCGQAVKNSLQLLGQNPESNITVLYRDMRTYGLMEDAYGAAREKGVLFSRSTWNCLPQVTNDNGQLSVTFVDHVLDRPVSMAVDAVVLSAGARANDTEELASLFENSPGTPAGFSSRPTPSCGRWISPRKASSCAAWRIRPS